MGSAVAVSSPPLGANCKSSAARFIRKRMNVFARDDSSGYGSKLWENGLRSKRKPSRIAYAKVVVHGPLSYQRLQYRGKTSEAPPLPPFLPTC